MAADGSAVPLNYGELPIFISSHAPSEDLGKPEGTSWSSVCCWPITRLLGLVVFIVTLALWVVSMLLAAMLDMLCCCRTARIPTAAEAYRNPSYRPFGSAAQPILCGNRPYRVAIIGAGWTGVGVAKELKERGAQVSIFESYPDVGGTWYSGIAYHGLSIHATAWSTEFHDFPYPAEDRRDTRLTAAEMHQYIRDYCQKFDIFKLIKFNARVTKVSYTSANRKTSLQVTSNEGRVETFDDFDLVVYGGFATYPSMPHWKNEKEFKGKILHTSQVQTPQFQSIVKDNARVVVVGGSKSGVDVLCSFHKIGHGRLTWLSRSSYIFARYSTIFHGCTFRGMTQGGFYLQALSLSLLWPRASALLMAITRMTVVPSGWSLNLRHFHLGILDDDQVRIAAETPRVTSEIDRFTPTGVILKNGQKLECEYVICATGYRTGMNNIVYEADKKEQKLDPYVRLFEGLVRPSMPRFVFAFGNAYDFGTKRSVPLVDHIFSYLVRFPDPARVPPASPSNSLEVSTIFGINFSPHRMFIVVFLTGFISLIRWGVLSPFAMMKHVFGVFVFNKVNPLELKQPRFPARSAAAAPSVPASPSSGVSSGVSSAGGASSSGSSSSSSGSSSSSAASSPA